MAHTETEGISFPSPVPLHADFGVRRILDHFEASLDPLDPAGRFLKPTPRLHAILGLGPTEQIPLLPELPAMAGHRELVATALRSGSDLQIPGAIAAAGDRPALSLRLFPAPTGTRRRWVILTPAGPDQPLAISGMESLGLLLMHEVNNVLTTLAGFADYHLSATELPDGLKDSLQDASQLAKRSGRIMEFLRILAHKDRLEEEPIPEDPNGAIRELVELAGWLVGSKHKLLVELTAKPDPLPLQPRLLRLALLNLLLNALKALGSLPGTIHLRTSDVENDVVIAIGDSGPGIDPELRDRLFNPGATDGGGLGLGLALVKEVALRHGGHTRVREMDETGVEISLVLPRISPATK